MSERFDIIIIGTGAGGGTLAHHLAPTGRRILLLERGGVLPREKENWDSGEVFVKSRYKAREIWRDKNGREFHPGIHYYVGGNTKVYGAALLRFRQKDFSEVRHSGGVSPAWPISYEDLALYYSRAEQLYDVHGLRGSELTRAALALSIFWATMAGGRLLISVLLLKIAPERIWLALPLLMTGAFLLLPFAHTPVRGIALFAFAGLACSAFFPISVGLISKQFSANAAFVSSLMIASLMIGVGVGSYVIGPLSSSFSIETLYRLSALYPASVFVLALMVVKRRAQRAEGSLSE